MVELMGMKAQVQLSVGSYNVRDNWHLWQLFEIKKEYYKWEFLILILSCLVMSPTFCHAT
jgi:hypothetical protein